VKWEDQLDQAGASDVGMRRSNNQDSYRILTAPNVQQWRSRGHLFMVADGMGAHAVGELASKMAVDTVPHTYHKLANLECNEAITKAVQDANGLIHNRGTANKEFEGMGTTSTVLLLLPEGALIAHVGDSRAYRVRDGIIEQLSFDHSLAWELVRRRQLTMEQARTMVPNNVITRSLGPEPTVQVDVEGPHDVRPGDAFLLCSDGLSGMVGDVEMGAVAGSMPAKDACQFLIDMANLNGGADNITLLIVRLPVPPDAGKSGVIAKQSSAPRNYSTLLMILGVVSILGCVILGLMGRLLFDEFNAAGRNALAGAALEGFVLLLVGVLWRFLARPTLTESPTPQANSFRPPTPCSLDKQLLTRFAARLQQLRDFAVKHAWNVDWTEFFAHRAAGDKAIEAGELLTAISEFAQAQRLLAIGQKRHRESTQSLLDVK
jgi:protein phosphatase